MNIYTYLYINAEIARGKATHKSYHRSWQNTLKLPLYESVTYCTLSETYKRHYIREGAGLDKASISFILYKAMHYQDQREVGPSWEWSILRP